MNKSYRPVKAGWY